MAIENANIEFGRSIAEAMWQEGIRKCPFVLNSEQADALRKRWKELQRNPSTFGKPL